MLTFTTALHHLHPFVPVLLHCGNQCSSHARRTGRDVVSELSVGKAVGQSNAGGPEGARIILKSTAIGCSRYAYSNFRRMSAAAHKCPGHFGVRPRNVLVVQ